MTKTYRSQTKLQGEGRRRRRRRSRYGREAEVEVLDRVLADLDADPQLAVSEAARRRSVPDSTLRDWLKRARDTKAPDEEVRFFESPAGLKCLKRIVLAAMYVLTQVAGGGYRTVTKFLKLSGLSAFAASSHGTMHRMMTDMEKAIIAGGDEMRRELAEGMESKNISVVADECFHKGKTCLVALEPLSQFLLVEQYADDRKAATWKKAIDEGLDGLSVEVTQLTTDRAKALLKLASDEMEVHHNSDLFHPIYDISRGTSLALRRKRTAAEEQAIEAEDRVDELVEEAAAYEANRTGPGRSKDYVARIEVAHDIHGELERQAEDGCQRVAQVVEARRAISAAYSPYNVITGQIRDAEQAEKEFNEAFDTIEQIAEDARLSQSSHDYIAKARRVVSSMVGAIAFFHTLVLERVKELGLAPNDETDVIEVAVAAKYLELAADKAQRADDRHAIRSTAAGLQAKLEADGGLLSRLETEQERAQVDHVAQQCAEAFQRSSSAVEGRNGVLALRHHSHHHLSARKLQAATVVHNFGTRRPDGTTPAQRFFGKKHPKLFEHLLDALPPPARPAASRRTLH